MKSFVALDLETTGRYPLESEICEIAAIKYRGGQIVDRFETLIRPSRPMGEAVMAIHHITNEMVAAAPAISSRITALHRFIEDSYLIAHHAPFDMGFLAVEFEAAGLPLPALPAFCTSLMARRLFPTIANHRLATLVAHFGVVTGGAAHRAMADTQACLGVAIKCFEKVGAEAPIEALLAAQQVSLVWPHYSILALEEFQSTQILIAAIRQNRKVELEYGGGSQPGRVRTVRPIGLVRNPEGDFVAGFDDDGGTKPKRYYLNKVGKVSYTPDQLTLL